MEAQTALVGPDGAVELNAEATVHMNLAGVVNPRNAEDDRALRLDHALQDGMLLVTRIGFDYRTKRLQNLGNCLNELRLIGVLLLNVRKDVIYVRHISPSVGISVGFFRSVALHRKTLKPILICPNWLTSKQNN